MTGQAASLDAAILQSQSCQPGTWAAPLGELRTLVLGSTHSKTSAERYLRRQLQEQLASLPSASHPADRAAGGSSPTHTVWAIEFPNPETPATPTALVGSPAQASGGSVVLVGTELARGGSSLAGRRQGPLAVGGPTQMKAELALATANLAALPRVSRACPGGEGGLCCMLQHEMVWQLKAARAAQVQNKHANVRLSEGWGWVELI